jgi:hypothetical protein
MVWFGLVWFGLVREGASSSVIRAMAADAGAGVVLLMVFSLLFSHHPPQLNCSNVQQESGRIRSMI